jgi:pimeloyl-ACP methyl ester carboxylesterase
MYGEGPPLVLVHGNPCDHWLWLYQIPVFSHRYRVIAVDLRAYGRSDKPTEPFSIPDLGDDLLAVFEREALGDGVVCGLSIGASVVMDFTLRYSGRVRGLVVVGGGSSGAQIRPFMEKRISGITAKGLRAYLPEYFPELLSKEFLDSSIGRAITQMYIDNADALNPESVIRMYQSLSAYEPKARLPQIRVPTLVVTGENDMARNLSREIHELIAGSRFELIPGASHACCMDSPVEFNRALSSFLASLG